MTPAKHGAAGAWPLTAARRSANLHAISHRNMAPDGAERTF